MAKSSRRHCLLGHDVNGHPVYMPASGKDRSPRTLIGPAEDGKPIPPGCGLASVEVDDDGEHAMIEEIVAAPHSGPAQVATDVYRKNWDATFVN